MIKKILFISLFFLHSFIFSQEDAWVFFSDKENVAESIANPITILTQASIDRKALHTIPIDERDVPVNESYIDQVKMSTGITVYAKSKWFNAVHVRGTETDINALLNLAFVDQIEFADRSLNGSRAQLTYNDKFEVENARVVFNYGNTANQVEMLNLHLLHQSDYTGEGMTIAVLDAGFPTVNTQAAYQRLRDQGKLLDGYDFVNRDEDVYAYTGNDHGAKVLSTMGGFLQDEFVGTAPDASYYLFRTEDAGSENPVEESYWVEAAERADSLGVNILNTSLGYKNYDNPNYSYLPSDFNGNTAFITRGSTIASEKGMLVVNSAGNGGANGINAPADAINILSIGAVDENGNYASFSSQGSDLQPTLKPDVMARGSASFVISGSGIMVQNSGTSFSSPILAGAAACLWQAFPEMTNEQIMTFIRESGSQFTMPDYFMGYGIPDFQLALQNGLLVQAAQRTEFKLFPNPLVDHVNIIFPGNVDQAEFFVFDVLGKLIHAISISSENSKIDLQNLSNGIYLAKINAANNTSQTFKLIKE
ncbi:MAG: S8 family serine peptidase [Bacteroidia bacterium]|nr:S8 family serine peptidase [Bacteroidia bacterium]NND26154.1 S8 family serine peptidase [Flavobacteriaceae bacterium]RZW49665.1 MAG: T9SS type A sorting domain-containing protein [Flavobacteriaceae bacterium]